MSKNKKRIILIFSLIIFILEVVDLFIKFMLINLFTIFFGILIVLVSHYIDDDFDIKNRKIKTKIIKCLNENSSIDIEKFLNGTIVCKKCNFGSKSDKEKLPINVFDY